MPLLRPELLDVPGAEEALDYPSLGAADQIILCDFTTELAQAPSLILPATDRETAMNMCLAWSGAAEDRSFAPLEYIGSVGDRGAAKIPTRKFALKVLGSYANELQRIRSEAYAITEKLARKVKSGGKLTVADLQDIRLKRLELTKALKDYRLPVYDFKMLSAHEYAKELEGVELGARETSKRWQRRQLKKINFQQKKLDPRAFPVAKTWAKRFSLAGKILVAIDFAQAVAEAFSADTVEEANAAHLKIVRQTAEFATSMAMTSALSTASTALGLAAVATPVGWAIVGVGLVAGIGAGIFAGDLAEVAWKHDWNLAPH